MFSRILFITSIVLLSLGVILLIIFSFGSLMLSSVIFSGEFDKETTISFILDILYSGGMVASGILGLINSKKPKGAMFCIGVGLSTLLLNITSDVYFYLINHIYSPGLIETIIYLGLLLYIASSILVIKRKS